eukprot:TRINITY_DN1887_c0_g3_i4.p1 TRINITY_DN1887_c0_g3~~TRINITY_DN1887_c0_g3_i4.p1  ORF type:complete len:249 (+),score=34.98 TRINITY_DN1887_c0_g3_i4:104-850(+)
MWRGVSPFCPTLVTRAAWRAALAVAMFAAQGHAQARWLALSCFFVQNWQLASFAVDPWVARGADETKGTRIVSRILALPRTFCWDGGTRVLPGLCGALFAVSALLLASFCVGYYAQRVNKYAVRQATGKLMTAARWALQFWASVLHFPVLHITLSLLVCTNGQCPDVSRIFALLLILTDCLLTLPSVCLQYDIMLTSRHPFAHALPRVELLWFCSSLLMSVAYHLLSVRNYPAQPVLCSVSIHAAASH